MVALPDNPEHPNIFQLTDPERGTTVEGYLKMSYSGFERHKGEFKKTEFLFMSELQISLSQIVPNIVKTRHTEHTV